MTEQTVIVSLLVFGALVALGAVLIALSSRRGAGKGSADPLAWVSFARARGLTLSPGLQDPVVSGEIDGVPIRISAELFQDASPLRTLEADRDGGARRGTAVSTRVRGAFRVPMPVGLQLRRQGLFSSLAEDLVADGEIVVGDAPVDDAFVIQGADPIEIGAFLAVPDVRAALMALHATGHEVLVDEGFVTVVAPHYVTDSAVLDSLVDGVLALVLAARAGRSGSAAPEARPVTPVPALLAPPSLPSLQHLLNRVSQGADLLATRAAADAIVGLPCHLEIDVSHVGAYVSRVDRPDGRLVTGVLVNGTTRVDVHFPRQLEEATAGLREGGRFAVDAYVDAYDATRDHAQVTADGPPTAAAAHPRVVS